MYFRSVGKDCAENNDNFEISPLPQKQKENRAGAWDGAVKTESLSNGRLRSIINNMHSSLLFQVKVCSWRQRKNREEIIKGLYGLTLWGSVRGNDQHPVPNAKQLCGIQSIYNKSLILVYCMFDNVMCKKMSGGVTQEVTPTETLEDEETSLQGWSLISSIKYLPPDSAIYCMCCVACMITVWVTTSQSYSLLISHEFSLSSNSSSGGMSCFYARFTRMKCSLKSL